MLNTPNLPDFRRSYLYMVTLHYLKFKVTACSDALIELRSDNSQTDNSVVYEFLIGYNNNQNTSITVKRDGRQLKIQTANTPNILECKSAKEFWVSWKSHKMEIGTGSELYKNQLISFTDPNQRYVATASFASKRPSGVAEWEFAENTGITTMEYILD